MAPGQKGSQQVRRTNAFDRRGCRIILLLGVLAGSAQVQAQSVEDTLPRLRLPTLAVRRRPDTLQSRWDKFEAEFGLPEQPQSPLTASLLRAKYGVDVAAFGIKAISSTFQDATELRFSRGRVRRASTADLEPSPRYARPTGPFTIEDARLKFDFELATGKPYIGARLVFPFGN